MLKKSAILGLVLLLAGSAVLGWVLLERRTEQHRTASCRLKYSSEPDEYLRQYNQWLQLSPEKRAGLPLELNGFGQAKTKAQLKQEQQERLKADLDRLANGELNAHLFADVLYGEDWQSQVNKYKKRKELDEFILTGSVVCTSIGGTTFGWCLLLWTARLLIAGTSRLRGSSADGRSSRSETDDDGPPEADAIDFEQQQKPLEQPSRIPLLGRIAKWELGELGKSSQIQANSGRQNSKRNSPNARRPAVSQTTLSTRTQSQADKHSTVSAKERLGGRSAKSAKKIAVVVSDEKSVELKKSPTPAMKKHNFSTAQRGLSGQKASHPASAGRHESSPMLEESLKAKTDNLEKQMAQFRDMARSIQQTTLEHSKPLNGTLKELTDQISAIREYAAHQHERVEKLQDGYDWNIIRTFCLRVIRCIDNLESRIDRLSEKDVETEHLTEVKDELIFALESSGIEQFRPEVNSLYRGQEKCTEAVKEKEHCDDPKKAGKISKVVRPGYQYFINEGNVKVVRAAQVKLFD